MRVCIVAHRFYDANSHMMQFANALARRGDEVDVVSLRWSGLSKYEVVDGVHVYRIQGRILDESRLNSYLFRKGGFLLAAAAVVGAHHVRKPYDLIQVQAVPDFLVLAALVPKLTGVPVILDLRDLTPELYASKFGGRHSSTFVRFLAFLEKLSAAFATHVIIANPIWYERVIGRSATRAKCSMFWYYPDPTLFYPRPRQRRDRKFLIMYPGTLSWHQGVDFAIKAFPRILREVPEAEFHIYGDGPAKAPLKALAEALGVQDKVKLLDPLPLKKMVEVMAQSDLGLVPKRASSPFGDEAASTKIPEFMAVGVPVVASRTRVESCLYNDCQICYFRSEDEEDLARAVSLMYHQPELRQRFVTSSQTYVEQNSWNVGMSHYLRLVDRLAQPNSRDRLERNF